MNLSKDLFCKGLPVSFSLVVIMTFFAPKANAVYGCSGAGPGERVVGETQAGNGVASYLLCESDPNYQEEPEDRGSDSSRYYDPKFAELQFQGASALLNLRQQLQLLQDPKYLKYLSGSWKLFPTSRLEGVKSGSSCVASFFKASMDPEAKDAPVMINLLMPSGNEKFALLTFAAERIPKPKTIQTITVTLIQNNDPPATVKALNYTMPNLPYGVIAFTVPSVDAALAAIEDAQHFDVKIDGKSVAKTMWHSGLKVKDELRKCLNGKPYSVTEIDIVPERLKKP